jgi:hypothetical protein
MSDAGFARATNDNFLRLFSKVPRASLKAPKNAA